MYVRLQSYSLDFIMLVSNLVLFKNTLYYTVRRNHLCSYKTDLEMKRYEVYADKAAEDKTQEGIVVITYL